MPERRREPAERPVVPDVALVEHEVVHGGAAGHGQAVGFRSAHDLDGVGARDHRRVVAGLRQAHEADVALQHHRLGLAGDAEQAEAGGHLALVHHAVADEIRLLHVLHQEDAEIARIGERAAHHLGVPHRLEAVGEGDGPRLLQQAELGHLLPEQALGDGGGRQDVDARRIARPAQHEIHDGRPVDDRVGVGHAHEGGDAAGGRRRAGARQGLAMLGAGLAHEGAQVDEPGAEDVAGAIDRLGLVRNPGEGPPGDILDPAVAHDDMAGLLAARGRIAERGVGEQDGTHRHASRFRPGATWRQAGRPSVSTGPAADCPREAETVDVSSG